MKRGFSNLITIFITSFFVLSLVAYFLFYRSTDPVVEISNEQKINDAVINNFQNQDIDNNFKITNISQKYAKGQILINGELQNVYLVLNNGEWKIAILSAGSISCEKGQKFGFPNSIIEDCLFEFPKAKTPEDVNSSSSNLSNNEKLEIIGDIIFGEDPFSGNFQISGEDGDTVTVNYNFDSVDQNDINNISDSDYVVVDVNVVVDEDGNLDFDLESIQEIETNTGSGSGNSGGSSNNSGGSNNNGTSISDTNLSEEIYYDITDLPPDAVIDFDEYYRSLIDRDFSNQEIEIDSDF